VFLEEGHVRVDLFEELDPLLMPMPGQTGSDQLPAGQLDRGAISRFIIPSPASETICDRNTNRAGVLRPRDQRKSVARSSSVNTRSSSVNAIVGAIFMASSSLQRMPPRRP